MSFSVNAKDLRDFCHVSSSMGCDHPLDRRIPKISFGFLPEREGDPNSPRRLALTTIETASSGVRSQAQVFLPMKDGNCRDLHATTHVCSSKKLRDSLHYMPTSERIEIGFPDVEHAVDGQHSVFVSGLHKDGKRSIIRLALDKPSSAPLQFHEIERSKILVSTGDFVRCLDLLCGGDIHERVEVSFEKESLTVTAKRNFSYFHVKIPIHQLLSPVERTVWVHQSVLSRWLSLAIMSKNDHVTIEFNENLISVTNQDFAAKDVGLAPASYLPTSFKCLFPPVADILQCKRFKTAEAWQVLKNCQIEAEEEDNPMLKVLFLNGGMQIVPVNKRHYGPVRSYISLDYQSPGMGQQFRIQERTLAAVLARHFNFKESLAFCDKSLKRFYMSSDDMTFQSVTPVDFFD